MVIRKSSIVIVICLGVLAGTMSVAATQNTVYKPDWESLKNYQVPEWRATVVMCQNSWKKRLLDKSAGMLLKLR